jgi:hypothetical protein
MEYGRWLCSIRVWTEEKSILLVVFAAVPSPQEKEGLRQQHPPGSQMLDAATFDAAH